MHDAPEQPCVIVTQRVRARAENPGPPSAHGAPRIQCALELTAGRVELRHERLSPQPSLRILAPALERARHVLVQQTGESATHLFRALEPLIFELEPASPRARELAQPPRANRAPERRESLADGLALGSPVAHHRYLGSAHPPLLHALHGRVGRTRALADLGPRAQGDAHVAEAPSRDGSCGGAEVREGGDRHDVPVAQVPPTRHPWKAINRSCHQHEVVRDVTAPTIEPTFRRDALEHLAQACEPTDPVQVPAQRRVAQHRQPKVEGELVRFARALLPRGKRPVLSTEPEARDGVLQDGGVHHRRQTARVPLIDRRPAAHVAHVARRCPLSPPELPRDHQPLERRRECWVAPVDRRAEQAEAPGDERTPRLQRTPARASHAPPGPHRQRRTGEPLAATGESQVPSPPKQRPTQRLALTRLEGAPEEIAPRARAHRDGLERMPALQGTAPPVVRRPSADELFPLASRAVDRAPAAPEPERAP